VALRPAILLVCAALLPASCGGDDAKQPEQVVRDFVKATVDRDSDKLCDKLLSPAFIAKTTGAKEGDTETCKQQIEAVTGLRLGLVDIKKTVVDGDQAKVTAVLRVQGQRQQRVFLLEKDDGDWKLAGGSTP
jgi:hypothetical protein